MLIFLWSKPRELTIHVTGSATVESQQGSSSFFSLLGVFIKSGLKQKLWLASAVIHDVCIFPFLYGLQNCSSNLIKHKNTNQSQVA